MTLPQVLTWVRGGLLTDSSEHRHPEWVAVVDTTVDPVVVTIDTIEDLLDTTTDEVELLVTMIDEVVRVAGTKTTIDETGRSSLHLIE